MTWVRSTGTQGKRWKERNNSPRFPPPPTSSGTVAHPTYMQTHPHTYHNIHNNKQNLNKYMELIFFWLWDAFSYLIKIVTYPILEVHNALSKIKLYLGDVSQKELESSGLIRSLLRIHFYSGQCSMQRWIELSPRQMQIIFIERSLFSSLNCGIFLAHNSL